MSNLSCGSCSRSLRSGPLCKQQHRPRLTKLGMELGTRGPSRPLRLFLELSQKNRLIPGDPGILLVLFKLVFTVKHSVLTLLPGSATLPLSKSYIGTSILFLYDISTTAALVPTCTRTAVLILHYLLLDNTAEC
eukprot:6179910-Pleurochrysis_carterae.AAC.5